jgi:CheY-like chemotaxis protein
MKLDKNKMNQSRKLNILIVDDVDENIESVKAQLIADPSDIFITPELIELAEANFNIYTFNIVGEALDFMEKSEAKDIDIAIIDLNFEELRSTYPNLPAIEYGSFRGADLIRRIQEQETTTVFCHTRYLWLYKDTIEEMKGESLHLLDKNDRQNNGVEFIKAFKNQARKYFSMLSKTEKYTFISFMNKEGLDNILNQTKIFGGISFILKFLLIGWAEAYYDFNDNRPVFRYNFNSNDILKSFSNDSTTNKQGNKPNKL